MSGQVCPYCRTPIDAEIEALDCPSCGTPHHQECWDENGGCTVFGCASAPVEEAKITVSSFDLGAPSNHWLGTPTFDSTGVPPPPLSQEANAPIAFPPSAAHSMLGLSEPQSVPISLSAIGASQRTDRRTYTLLGFFFGYLGLHNLYANRMSVGIIQLCVTVLTCFLASPATWIWALVEICQVDRDGDGYLMN